MQAYARRAGGQKGVGRAARQAGKRGEAEAGKGRGRDSTSSDQKGRKECQASEKKERTMPPKGPDLVLTSDIPHGERDVFVLDRLDVEAWRGDRMHEEQR